MNSGLQKMTLLDYPGKVACTVFLQGCNFRCPFCHNSGLLDAEEEPYMSAEELLAFLNKRKGLLDGVCITGGEPTLDKDLKELLTQIKSLGFLTKLDTNGSRPQILKELAEANLLDYVAMDIKNCPSRYGQTVGVENITLTNIESSIKFLLQGDVPFEFRTTVMDELHDEESMEEMGVWLQSLGKGRKPQRFFLQPYVERDSVLAPGLTTPTAEKLRKLAQIMAGFAENVEIRGLD